MNGSGCLLAASLAAIVALDEQGIAVTKDQRTLAFLDSSGRPTQELAVEQMSGQDRSALRSAYVWPYGWSDDGRAFWVEIMRGPFEYELCRIDVASWQVDAYGVAELPMGD